MTEISKPTAKLTPTQLRLGLGAYIAMFASWIYLFFSIFTGNVSAPSFVMAGVITGAYMVISTRNKKVLQAQGGDSASARLRSLIIIQHMAGLEAYNLQGAKSAMLVPEGIAFTVSKGNVVLLPWKKISHVEAGSEEQLRKRVTLSRVLFVGIFALAFKKERKQKFFLTIETTDGVGLWSINTLGKDNRQMQAKAMTFATGCNSRAKAADMEEITEPSTNHVENDKDPLEQIEKLGDLLSKGHITDEEFDSKKRDLLGRL